MLRILVVEDVREDMELLVHVLKKFPLEVTTCETASEARRLFETHSYHAALVNLALPNPEPDGIHLIRWLRLRSQEILIMVVTGADDPRRRSQAIEAGANGFFTKPYTHEDNLILLAQLQVVQTAKQRAYAKGNRMRNWRTNLGGACAALGTFLFGASYMFKSMEVDIPPAFVKGCMMMGFMMQGGGIFYMALQAADKKVVEQNLQEQRAINSGTEFIEKEQVICHPKNASGAGSLRQRSRGSSSKQPE